MSLQANSELSCYTAEWVGATDATSISIPGRCVLVQLWLVCGTQATNVGTSVTPLAFRTGSLTGDIVVNVPWAPTARSNPLNLISMGSGGILFDDGIYVSPQAVHARAFGAMTIIYEQG